MRTKPTMSLTSRLTIAIAAIVVVGGIVVTLLAWTYGQRAARDAFDRVLLGAADQISASISLSDGKLLVDLPTTAFDLLALSRDDRVIYRVAQSSGETLTGYDTVPLPDLDSDHYFYNADISGEPARLVAVARNFAERDYSGSTITVVGHTLNARNALAWDIMQNAWIILLLAGFGMAALAFFAIRSALEPLRRIGQHLLERDPEDLSPITLSVPHELSAFVAAINRFTGRLDRQMHVMQDLIADSAHQLRTPIAALRASVRNRIEDADPISENDALEKLHQQTIDLSRLADQLLSRALVIHRADASQLTPLDLRQVAIDAVETFDSLVPDGHAIRLDLPEVEVTIRGDAPSLVEAVKNLVSNALKYGDAPFEVVVAFDKNSASLAVCNAGVGMSPAGWRRHGRRFSRKRNNGGVGGLGISIVRAVILAHGGQLEIGRSHNDLFEVKMRFSISSESENT